MTFLVNHSSRSQAMYYKSINCEISLASKKNVQVILTRFLTSFPNRSSLLNQKFLLLKYLIFPEITALSEFELLELFLQTFCEFHVKFVLLLASVQFLFLAFNRTPRFTNNTYVAHFFMFYQLICWLKF